MRQQKIPEKKRVSIQLCTGRRLKTPRMISQQASNGSKLEDFYSY
jgi:hypothetical protein